MAGIDAAKSFIEDRLCYRGLCEVIALAVKSCGQAEFVSPLVVILMGLYVLVDLRRRHAQLHSLEHTVDIGVLGARRYPFVLLREGVDCALVVAEDVGASACDLVQGFDRV